MAQPQAALKNVYEELQSARNVLACFEGLEGKSKEEIVAEIQNVVGDLEVVFAPKRKGSGDYGLESTSGWGLQSDMASAYLRQATEELNKARKKIKEYKNQYRMQIFQAKRNSKKEHGLEQPSNG